MTTYEVRRLNSLAAEPAWTIVYTIDGGDFVPFPASLEYATEAEAQAEVDRLTAAENAGSADRPEGNQSPYFGL